MNIRVPVAGAVALVSVLASAAVYEVDSGETLTVTDANKGDYADGISFKDKTGTVLFDTTSAPAMPISGAGTVRKVSSSDWTMTADMKGMTGTFDLSGGGVVSFARDNAFCKSDAGTVIVSNGTTLSFTDVASRIRYAKLRIAGRGKDDRGALEFKNTSSDNMQLRYVTLDDDALITIAASCTMYGGNELNLNGHDLALEGAGTFSHVGDVKGEGNITLTRLNSGTLTWDMAATATFTPSKTSAICLTGNAKITQNRAPAKPNRPLHVSGTGNVLGWVDYWNSSVITTNGVGWAGDIVFAEGEATAQLQFSLITETRKQTFTILGKISGNGKLTLARYAQLGRLCLAYPENTFTGGIELKDGVLVPLYPGSLSDWSKITVDAAGIEPDADSGEGLEMPLDPEGTTGWTYAKGVELANLACWTASVYPRFSTELFKKATPAPLVYDPSATLASGKYIGSKTPTPLLAPDGDFFAPPGWDRGKLVLTGTMNVKAKTIDSQWASSFGWTKAQTAIENGYVTLTNGARWTVGNNYGGILSVSNAVFTSANPTRSDYTSSDQFTKDSIVLGIYFAERASGGVLYVEDGAVISNRLCVGGQPLNGGTFGAGSVFQRGGLVEMSGGKASDSGAGVLANKGSSHGYYELRGGKLTAHGSFAVGGYGSGSFQQYGGEIVLSQAYDGSSGSALWVGAGNAGIGSFYLENGTTTVNASLYVNNEYRSGEGGHARSTLSVYGPNAVLTANGVTAQYDGSSQPGQSAIVTVGNGGTLRTAYVSQGFTPDKSFLYVNFDGGTFVARGDNHDTFSAGRVNGLYVYGRGLTVDTAGKTGNKVTAPLTGATGKGVAAITLASPIQTFKHSVGQYISVIGAPVVVIEGDGTGASAVAKFDSATKSVHEIVVTAPGVGYTTATCKIIYANDVVRELTSESGAVVLADNANTGSFTKTGEGDLTLLATNTWGGATTVAGGTLKAGCDGAIPTNTAVTISGGGVLDLNGKAAKLASVSYGAGGGKIINATGADVPAADAITLSFTDVLAGRFVGLSGDIDLSDITLTLTGDIPAFDENAKYPVVKVADGRASGTPTIVSAPLPKGWIFRVNPSGVTIVKPKGLLLMVR